MRTLKNKEAIQAEIDHHEDPAVARLLADHLQYVSEYDDAETTEYLAVIAVEPGDTLQGLDLALDHQLLANLYSGKRYGENGFAPCFETLEEHESFYEMLFIQSDDGFGLSVIVPKRPDIDAELLSLCFRYASPAGGGAS